MAARPPSKPAKPRAAKPAATSASTGDAPVLLSGGNPQIAKGDGDAPVQAYIAAMPGWKGDIGRRFDALVAKTVPKAGKMVRWNSPFYGLAGQGWFVSVHCFTKFVRLTFFKGTALKPQPAGASKVANVRYHDIAEDAFDDKQIAAWLKQAAKLPGWVP